MDWWASVLLALGTLWTGGTQSVQPPGRYPVDWRDSVLLAPRYPVDWRDSVLLDPQVPCGLVGLSPFGPRYPGDWWDSVLSAPQAPYGLVGLSPFGHQVTLGLEDLAGHAYPDIYVYILYIVCIPWRPSTGGLVRAKQEECGLVFVVVLFVFSFIKIKWNVLNTIRMSSLILCCIRFFSRFF